MKQSIYSFPQSGYLNYILDWACMGKERPIKFNIKVCLTERFTEVFMDNRQSAIFPGT